MTEPVFVSRMKEVVGHLKAAQQIMNHGPLDYYFRKLVEQSDALLTRFTPIKINQRAVIVKKINCVDGWAGSEKNLAIGVEGRVINVDYYDGCFHYAFVPDVQMYKDAQGNYKESSSKASYTLTEGYL